MNCRLKETMHYLELLGVGDHAHTTFFNRLVAFRRSNKNR